MYKLKNTNGRVKGLFLTGKDLVKTEMSVSTAQHIVDNGELMESNVPDYPICVNNEWYFEGVKVKRKVIKNE